MYIILVVNTTYSQRATIANTMLMMKVLQAPTVFSLYRCSVVVRSYCFQVKCKQEILHSVHVHVSGTLDDLIAT